MTKRTPVKGIDFFDWSPSESLKNEGEVALALLECLRMNEPDGFIEILDGYLRVNCKEKAPFVALENENVSITDIAKIVHENFPKDIES